MNPAKVVYHEKQVRELCALHALNNLFQEKGAFSKSELDSICYNLSPENWINPHKSVLGLGNYDVNVIMRALQIRNYEMIWFDKRKDPSSIQLENVTGFILNVPTDYKFSFITIPLKRRHWIAVKLLNGLYYNLDSKLEHPVAIGNEEDLLNFLRTELDSQDKELFVITTSDSAKLSSWLKQQSDYNNKIVDSSNRDAEEVLLCNINPRTAVAFDIRGSQRQAKRGSLVQDELSTVQGAIEMGLKYLNPARDTVVCMASRTDAGVHALNTTCHFDFCQPFYAILEPDAITLRLNKFFVKSDNPIRILSTKIVPDDFHCRYNAISRTYLYRIIIEEKKQDNDLTATYFMPIEETNRAFYVSTNSFNLDTMREAAKLLEGFHDFRTFMATSKDSDRITRKKLDSIRIIERSKEQVGVSWPYSWPAVAVQNSKEQSHRILDMYFKGKGFLYKQVRRTAGTLLSAGTGQISLQDIRFMLEVPSKHSWNPRIKALPGYALYLCEIEY
ncbi:hypothetical protein HUJ04_001529 [Dendroctonus ponderosae]|nr:hypothetical protein HUJ04_001529 [Dendroctonus ponderosae]